ncbi:NPC intracellular cholesterol transporter 1 homolog 1b [Eumeta japonica]|uniref:NPC intracellular cholesterol transporter 1 homolog 1b n=1 Tax=Eumeta variegata TaxID=151549 RepID=A0A4C1V7N8_EUMVA|nr:NPC intracellular cholesterol transporter 1 homolog 1b [Eumeta japonica]
MKIWLCVYLCIALFAYARGQSINPWELPHLENAEHTCVMWGECHFDGRHHKNCYYNGPATRIFHEFLTEDQRDDVLQVLESRCQHLLHDEYGNRKDLQDVYGCCATEQILRMGESLMMAEGVLGRCPTCVRNYMRQTCELTCAPDQSRFLVPYVMEAPIDGSTYVNEIDYRMHDEFMNGAHASCAGVIVPQTGVPAINIMCGSAPNCTAQAWFDFSGDFENNEFVPFQVNYIATEDPSISMNAYAPPCNETFEGTLPCSCVDCLVACPIGTEPVVSEPCTVLSVNCVFSCNHPLVVIMITSWISIAMLYGFLMLNLTTNPIELWSSPESRTRQDLNYFNTRFGPFYRAAQVYIQITGLDPLLVEDENGNITTYGPAFQFEAIQEALALDNAIFNLGSEGGGIPLERVCFAPLRRRVAEQNIQQCVTMSISTYLRGDFNNATYLTRIQSCLNNYMNTDCLATWGGGSEPEIVFGGFEGDDILSADTLLLNFPISNFLSESELAPVLEWEQQFLDFLHDYEANHKPDFIDISYAAERSIEDEIERVSVAEMVPISYTGITTTLLAINVIPFFVLSIGVDNVFLMTNTLEDVKSKLKQYDDYKEGPPVYFVLTPGLNFTDPVHQNVICGGQLCNNDSLTTQIFLASRYSDITQISKSSNSWLDDFFDWSTLRGSCCRYVIDDETFCPSSDTSDRCASCIIDVDENGLRPIQEEFQRYIPFFLQDEPTETCNKGGLASYSTAVNYLLDEEGRATVYESSFMAYHTALSTSQDYTEALRYALEISDNITAVIHRDTGMTNVEVFPYAIFYVYYEQYLTIWADTFRTISYSMVGAFLFALILSGFNFFTTFAIIITVIMIVVDMMGLMYIWNIPLNAVSLVNLVVSIGIAVEFCSHTAYAYATSVKPIRERTEDALIRVGSTIITGITLTNIPIIVLSFSYTELIEIFFFRMFFGLVIIGFLHGMIFFPVLLSFMSNVGSYRSQKQGTS